MRILNAISSTILLLAIFKQSTGSRYNISLSDLIACKEYPIPGSYVYRNFFLIENIANDRPDNETILQLKFYVMAHNNAHILLSSVDNAKKNDPVYEIVIGAGQNTFAAIRQFIGGRQLITKKQNGVLNAIEPTPIIIKQKIDGEIQLIIPGFSAPFLSYKDTTPLHLKYVSFSSYGTTPARWFYDCEGEKAAHLEMEKRNLTDLERLQQHLLTNYSTYTIPHELQFIYFSSKIRGISFDAKKSIFETRMEINLKWHDPKLMWNPAEYGDLTVLKVSQFNCWTPSLVIMNSVGKSWTEFTPNYLGFVHQNGSVAIHAKQETVESWCMEGSQNWPWDDLRCSIDFAVHGAELTLLADSNRPISVGKMSEFTEWHLVNYTISSERINETEELWDLSNTAPISTDLSLKLRMKRNQLFYRKVFYTPLIVSAALITFSFILRGFKRGLLNLIALTVLLIGFVVLAQHTPGTYVPTISHTYELFLGIACFSYYLNIMNRWLTEYPPIAKPPGFVITIINFSPLRFILGMRFSDAAEYQNIQEFPWNEVATIFDRIFLAIIAITFAIVLSSQY